jgi:hypothetical protein
VTRDARILLGLALAHGRPLSLAQLAALAGDTPRFRAAEARAFTAAAELLAAGHLRPTARDRMVADITPYPRRER